MLPIVAADGHTAIGNQIDVDMHGVTVGDGRDETKRKREGFAGSRSIPLGCVPAFISGPGRALRPTCCDRRPLNPDGDQMVQVRPGARGPDPNSSSGQRAEPVCDLFAADYCDFKSVANLATVMFLSYFIFIDCS
jgi:hypothetical protein